MKSLNKNTKIQVIKDNKIQTFKKLKFKWNQISLGNELSFKPKQFEKFETWSFQYFRGKISNLNHCVLTALANNLIIYPDNGLETLLP